MLTGPIPVTEKVLEKSRHDKKDIDLWELNEAFASVVLRYMQALNISHDKINVNGGAIAMGHPARRDRRDDPRHRARRARAARQRDRACNAVHRRRHGNRNDHRARVAEPLMPKNRYRQGSDRYRDWLPTAVQQGGGRPLAQSG